MATLTVGASQQYSTIAAAVAASSSGDTINVNAGTYMNDFITIRRDLALNAVGGTVVMVATAPPPDGKAIITEGGAGVDVSITGFDISGAAVADGNGAAIRYEGGTLALDGVNIHDNETGLLAASDPAGRIVITNSVFDGNGSGTGFTHNIYVNEIASLTVRDSTVTGAVVGHQIKSRAASTTITGSLIADGDDGMASYEIDLPNGGVAVVEGNVVQKGEGSENPVAITFGEEGNVYANSSLLVQGNTIVNNETDWTTIAVRNSTDAPAIVTGNSLYGWTAVSAGPVSVSGNTALTTEPDLASLAPDSPDFQPVAEVDAAPASESAGASMDAGVNNAPATEEASTDAGTGTDLATEAVPVSEATLGYQSRPFSFIAGGNRSGAEGWRSGQSAADVLAEADGFELRSGFQSGASSPAATLETTGNATLDTQPVAGSGGTGVVTTQDADQLLVLPS